MAQLYDDIGKEYTKTRRADPAVRDHLFERLGVQASARCLDIACGSGNYTHALAARGGRWVGVDISRVMLAKAEAVHGAARFVRGDAARLPFRDGTFAGAVTTLAIHHFNDLEAVCHEAARVIDHGRWVIFTAFPEQMRAYWLNRYFPKMMERSIAQMPPSARVLKTLRDAGFALETVDRFRVTRALEDLFLYSGKDRPRIYFDPEVRKNISSFAALAEPDEIESGLELLAADLKSGAFLSARRDAESSVGDYIFIVARKNRRG